MNNLIRADLYKTKRFKSIYIVAIVCTLFSLFSALVFFGLDWFAQTLTQDGTASLVGDAEEMAIMMEAFRYDTAFMATKEILISDTLIYCLIAIFVVVSGNEFSSGTIKNSLTSGIDRTKIYWSKFVVSSIYTVAYYFVFWASAILSNMLLHGEGMSGSEWGELVLIAIKQLPIYIGVIAAGHCFVFSTQSNIGAIALYLATFTMFNAILPLINIIAPWEWDITLLFPLYQCIALTDAALGITDYLIIYGSTMAYLLLFLLAGKAKFKKSEIK